MPRWFGVFFIPPARSRLYRFGSALLGYDIRAGAPPLPSSSPSSSPPPSDGPDPRWSAAARPFGFHLTVVEAYALPASGPSGGERAWAEVERETAALLACAHPGSRFALRPRGLERWRDGEVWVLRFEASPALAVLQAALVARLSRLAERSLFHEELDAHPERYPERYQRARMRVLLTPRGLDSWRPHFTLLNPYRGPAASPITAWLEAEARALLAAPAASDHAFPDRAFPDHAFPDQARSRSTAPGEADPGSAVPAGVRAPGAGGGAGAWDDVAAGASGELPVTSLALVTLAGAHPRDPDARWRIHREFSLPGGDPLDHQPPRAPGAVGGSDPSGE